MNPFRNIKSLIKNQITKIVIDKKYAVSTTIVGSFNDSIGLSGISDIDLVIIVDILSEEIFNELVSSFKNINCSELGLKDYDLIINDTFGPLKLNSKKSIVFHLMIYDVKGHVQHVEESPFTCHSWEQSNPLCGKSLKDIYPVINIQLSDLLESRRGISSYVNDIEKGRITYRKYEFLNGNPIVVKDYFDLDIRHKLEYSFHITYHLINNLYKIITRKNESLNQEKLSEFYLNFDSEFEENIVFFNELVLWKKSGKDNPQNIIERVKIFINAVYILIKNIDHSSNVICFKRHQKTKLNDGTFLGSKRNPSIDSMDDYTSKNKYNVGYHSKLRRSRETIKYYNCEILVETALINEIDYGQAEGLTIIQLSNKFSKITSFWDKGLDPKFPEGECQEDVLERVKKFIESEMQQSKDSLVVTHLVVLRMILLYFLEMPLKDMHKIQINHLEDYEFLNFKTYYSPKFSSEFRSKIRTQLSLING
tara:strand:- start:40198 stop:41634 length:1437 start_codon:yes stop_codon:yes gene_type:complete